MKPTLFDRNLACCRATGCFNTWVHSPQLIIGLFPNWFAPPAPDWPSNVALTRFPLWDEVGLRDPSPGLAEFLATGTPPIVFTAGSAMVHASRFFQVSARFVEALGGGQCSRHELQRVESNAICTLDGAWADPELPSNVLIRFLRDAVHDEHEAAKHVEASPQDLTFLDKNPESFR